MASHPAPPKVPDDNLITRRKNVAKGIEEIRGKKSEIAQALRELGKSSEAEDNKPLMRQLVEAFDVLSTQENQYLDILQTIVTIHEQATKDIADDFEKKISEDAERLRLAKEQMNEEPQAEEQELPAGDDDQDMKELREALLELRKVSEAAVAASELNDKLVERLQLHKKKKTAMMEIRTKKAKDLDEEAAKYRRDITERMSRLAAEKANTVQKQKELGDLRKQCLRFGIQVGQEEENEKATAILAADDVLTNENQRIPPIAKVEGPEKQQDDETLETRRKEIRENVRRERERKEEVNKAIREKLAAMEARKQRIIEIRSMLEENTNKQNKLTLAMGPSDAAAQNGADDKIQGSASESSADGAPDASESQKDDAEVDETVDLDAIISNAKSNLSSLTAMRERLEQMQLNGGPSGDEDRQLIENLERSTFGQGPTSPNEVEDAVREAFRAVNERATGAQAENRRLLLQLLELPTRRAAAPSKSPSPNVMVDEVRRRLLVAPRDVVGALAVALTQLADGDSDPAVLLPLLKRLFCDDDDDSKPKGKEA